jgi:hypothetical protein
MPLGLEAAPGMRSTWKGINMKRIASTLVALALAGSAAAAMAADTPYPSSVPEEYPLSQEFPNMDTYKKEHRDSVATQPSVPGPASVPEEYSLDSEFPSMVTYKREHRNDPVAASTTPFPTDVPNEPSMADEGLVPGIAGVPPYDNRGAVGATR